MIKSILITAILGYLIGSIQPSYLIIKLLKKQDIRKTGFGNAGASNTVSSYGWKYGIIVGFLDVIKPLVSIFILNRLISSDFVEPYNYSTLLNGLFVIIGHNYPFYMGFKGGKGTASLVGLIFALGPIYGVIGMLIFVISAIASNYIVSGTISLLIYFVALVVFLGLGPINLGIALLIALQSFYLHIPNLKRISNDTETTISSKLKK